MGEVHAYFPFGTPLTVVQIDGVSHRLQDEREFARSLISCQHEFGPGIRHAVSSELLGTRVERNVCIHCSSVVLATGEAWTGPELVRAEASDG